MILQSPAKQHTLYSWNLTSGSLRSVDLDANPIFTHWNEDASVVTVVELDLPESLCRFFRKKYSTADDNLILIESKLLVTKPRHSQSYDTLTTAFRYNQYLCRYGTAVTQYLAGANLDAPMFISYRPSTDHLTVFTIDNSDTLNTHIPDVDISQSRLLSPDGLVYSPSLTNELKVHNVFTPGIKRDANFPTDYQDFFQGIGNLTFGNHQLYGVIGTKGIAVWAFDPDLNFC
jgi:hypothetical protein